MAGRDVLEFEGRRPSVIFNEGAVACAQPLAANIGLGKSAYSVQLPTSSKYMGTNL